MKLSPLLFKDFYKTDHRRQYPEGVTRVYSNFTPRTSRIPGIKEVVVFGVQGFVQKFLVDGFRDDFFKVHKEDALAYYKRRMDTALGPNAFPMDHVADLWELGYLPIRVKALPEGTLCPLKVPMLTITNTHDKFAWLPNDLETLLSCELWYPMTSATIAHQYRKLLDNYAEATGGPKDFVNWQGHDFSMRGMTCIEAAVKSGAGHLLSFTGTDTIPAIDYLEKYYGANGEKELIGGSVPATEHAVMCLGGKDTERDTFRRLIKDVYPKGVVSIVSDTWDFWHTISQTTKELKDLIMSRDGKVVFRPDSGDPADILCGTTAFFNSGKSVEEKGAVQVLWEIFGGKVNDKGYKELDPHVGLIYGDSITLEVAENILARLKDKGFASTNVVFGIGSYTYQYVTRDTFGFAMKATHVIINGEPVELYKAPKTDSGMKNSAKGLLQVTKDLTLKESCTVEEEKQGLLQVVFEDGNVFNTDTLANIRNRLNSKK